MSLFKIQGVKMTIYSVLVTILCSVTSIVGYPLTEQYEYSFPLIKREAWGASPPSFVTCLDTPVPYVAIHHTHIPSICMTEDVCKSAMRSMQISHQNVSGWADIGYNFAVGGDGFVYEGRGWNAVGAHAVGYNTQSIGIALIGSFVSELPPAEVLQTTKELISAGVEQGYIAADYKLIGHRQVSSTECPGEVLFEEIKTWDHFSDIV